MRYLISYLYHFFVSNSRHGTHSPFVYALAEKVIYNSAFKCSFRVVIPEGFKPKYIELLRKILCFWEIPILSTDYADVGPKAYLIEKGIGIDINRILEIIDQEKIIIIHEPYKNENKVLWHNLISNDRVTVSINLFHFGIVLKRTGQRKEDFLLRYFAS